MKKIYYSLCLLLSLFIWTSCDKGGEERVDLKYEARTISVSSISPVAGYIGENLTINGKQFGVSPELMKVFIGEDETEIISCSEEQLIVKVPQGATTGKIILNLMGDTYVSELTYTVLGQPSVTAISPVMAFANDEITITGDNFGSTVSAVKLGFTGTKETALVVSCENTKIIAKVPAKAVTGPIDLTISKQHVNTPLSTGSGEFTVLQHASFTEMSAVSGYRGATVTLKGEGFVGTDEKSLKVYFGDTEAEVVSSTNEEIVIIVPEEATNGDNAVMVETAYELIEAVQVFNVLPSPVITEVSSESDYVGATVTITGENFPKEVDNVKVRFGNNEATIVSNSETELQVLVPSPIDAQFGELDLTISMSDIIFYTGRFIVKETPYITSVTSTNIISGHLVTIGDEITVVGRGFTEDVQVNVGGIEVTPTAITETEIKVNIPVGFTDGEVVLKFKGIPTDVTSDKLTLLVNGTDITEFVLKNYKQPFVGLEVGSTADWQTPMYWNPNAEIKNRDENGVGGMLYEKGTTYLAFQRGYGRQACYNGKMSQSFKLPAGKYKLEAVYPVINLNNGKDHVYIIMGKGTSNNDIPNIDKLDANSDVYVYAGTQGPASGSGIFETEIFELSETSDVIVGFLITIDNDKRWFKVSELKLIYVE